MEADKPISRKKTTKKADVVGVSKPTAQEEADQINTYLAQYWANQPKMERLKANITMMMQKFAIDHPDEMHRIQACFVSFSMIEDRAALMTIWAMTFKGAPIPTFSAPIEDWEAVKDLLRAEGIAEATWKKQKDPYFSHPKSTKKAEKDAE